MNTSARKILFFDKTILFLSIAVLSVTIFTVITALYAKKYENENNRLRTQLAEIQSLSKDVVRIKTSVESKEKKIDIKKSAGVVSTLEQILTGLGLEARVIRPLDKLKINGFTEENAELEIQGADLNSIVNLLYKIEISPLPLKIKTADIKTTFEDPNKFIFKLTVSLMSKG